MIAFKSDLTEEQRWKVVSFILSPVAPTATPPESTSSAASSTAATPDASAKSRSASGPSEGDPVKGRELFYDLANQRSCHGCHSINGVGGKVGPDLGAVASSRSSAELAASVLKPHIVDDSKYTTVTLTLADGDKIVGIRKEEAGDMLSVYDTTVLPAVLRTVPKSEIVRIETSPRSIMPADYASVYTERQLADIVAFIKSASARTERER
jgi:putative heme-binding domain-containing protein